MDDISREVAQRLQNRFGNNIHIDFHDERGDGRHFFLSIVSEIFEGKTRVERSQLVYEILGDLLKKDAIHALRMHCKTPNELIN